jgi:hypothetical protein
MLSKAIKLRILGSNIFLMNRFLFQIFFDRLMTVSESFKLFSIKQNFLQKKLFWKGFHCKILRVFALRNKLLKEK